MKTTWMMKFTGLAFAAALVVPVSLLAQVEGKGDKGDKGDKDKVKKDVQQIIVTRKGDKAEKVVIEIVGDKVTINGKPVEEYKDKDGDVSVRLNKLKDLEGYAWTPKVGGTIFRDGDNFKFFSEDANRAMLGVTTEKTDLGVEVNDVTKESAAEKIGLKPGDVITKVDDVKIESPNDLSAAIKKHKPGDKVTVTYLRDKKEQKATAELSKWKGIDMHALATPGQNFKFDMGENFDKAIPRALTIPRVPGQGWSGGGPKLGLSVQDTDDGKGVKVIEVDEESNAAKAGIKNEDVIMEVDGKAVNSTDEMVKIVRESKEKTSVMIKLQRSGKVQNVEVKMPRRIKTADL